MPPTLQYVDVKYASEGFSTSAQYGLLMGLDKSNSTVVVRNKKKKSHIFVVSFQRAGMNGLIYKYINILINSFSFHN